MLAKLQHIDTNCIHVPSSTKNSTSSRVSVSQPPNKAQPINKIPNGGVKKRLNRVYKKPHEPKTHQKHELGSTQNGFSDYPDGESSGSRSRVEKKRGSLGGNGVVKRTHAKCSTKWLRYGGFIPAMLEALETVADLDEALGPWEKRLGNKERTIILKEQSSWERALEIFEWFKRKGCYELNVIHYNVMLRILGRARKWGLVESLWDEMGKRGIVPKNSSYGTLIDVYSKGGLKDEALRWLKVMAKQGMEPDEVTMGTVVQLHKKAGEFEKAEQFFKKWCLGKSLDDDGENSMRTTCIKSSGCSGRHGSLSPHTYNNLIDTYGKAGKLKEASEAFQQMLKDGVVPNTVTFNTMIHVCGNQGCLEEVASLIHQMDELQCSPDTRTYSILIAIHVKYNDIEMAANYFKKMKAASLEPNLVSYRTLLHAFSIRHMVDEAEDLVKEIEERGLEIDEFTQSSITRMYIEAGMLDKSWFWFNRFHLRRNMSSDCYSANIDAFGEHGHVLEAERVFISCLEYKTPSVLEFNVMIKAYGIKKECVKACQLFDSMEKYNVVPDKYSYNTLIQMLASADLPHLAVLYVRKMHGAGFVSDCSPYCAVISSFVKSGQFERAEGVYSEMVGLNVTPDIIVYGVLVNAFADTGSVKKALKYVAEMKKACITVNTVICKSLIKLYTKVGYLKEAEVTYKVLRALELDPDTYSSNCMIDLYSERCMVNQAEGIFGYLKRKGHANEFSYAMMLCMYKKLERFEEAAQIAQKMKELGLLSDLLSYNHVLWLYASAGRYREALRTFKEIIESSIQPDDYTFRALGVVLCKSGVPEQAVSNLESTRRKNALSGLQAWVSTVNNLLCVIFDTNEVDYDDDLL